MKVKDQYGEWKQVSLSILISVEGNQTKETEEIIKILEDFMSTVLVTPYRLVDSLSESRTQRIPITLSKRSRTYSRTN